MMHTEKAIKRIGITGSIGAGKTLVSDYLRRRGYTVICADRVTREVSRPGEPGHAAIMKAFGERFFDENGELDRKKFSRYIFADRKRVDTLNQLLHPVIWDNVQKKAMRAEGTVFIDAALLIEGGFLKDVDQVWLVTADEETRIDRLKKRGAGDMQNISKRMAAQMPDAEKIKYADVVIDNSGEKARTYEQIEDALRKYHLWAG